MKEVVLEKYDDKIIVMTDDGQFIEKRVVNNSVDIGEEIIIDNNWSYKRNHNSLKRFISIAAAIILMITGGFGVYGCYYPFGYVNVDINPSVEIAYNLYHKVISIKGLNKDGEIIVNRVQNYKNKSVNEVIESIIDNAVKDKYIADNKENTILVTVSEKGSKIDDEVIYESVKEHIKEIDIPTEVVMEESNKKIFNEAKEKGISPGKLKLLNKVIENNKNVDIEEIKNKPVKDIMNIINENKKNNKENDSDKEKEDKKYKENKNNNEKGKDKIIKEKGKDKVIKEEKKEKVEKWKDDNPKPKISKEGNGRIKETKDKNKDNKIKIDDKGNDDEDDENEGNDDEDDKNEDDDDDDDDEDDDDDDEDDDDDDDNKNKGKGKNP